MSLFKLALLLPLILLVLDLDILKPYLHTEIKCLCQGYQKLQPEKDTDIQTNASEHITTPLGGCIL